MSEATSSRGWQGTVLKLLRAGDYELTVTARHLVTEHYLRLSFAAGGMLADGPLHPTMWVRMWFPNGGKVHQRGYTLVDPDPETDTVDIEFALHDGIASRWAVAAQPGDTIDVTVLGSNFVLPDPAPAGYVIVGDCASLPAINSLLDEIGEHPAKVFLESTHADDATLPVRRGTDVSHIDREHGGEALVRAVSAAAFDAAEHFGWVACDSRTTRAVVKTLREEYGIPRKSIKAQAYWEA